VSICDFLPILFFINLKPFPVHLDFVPALLPGGGFLEGAWGLSIGLALSLVLPLFRVEQDSTPVKSCVIPVVFGPLSGVCCAGRLGWRNFGSELPPLPLGSRSISTAREFVDFLSTVGWLCESISFGWSFFWLGPLLFSSFPPLHLQLL